MIVYFFLCLSILTDGGLGSIPPKKLSTLLDQRDKLSSLIYKPGALSTLLDQSAHLLKNIGLKRARRDAAGSKEFRLNNLGITIGIQYPVGKSMTSTGPYCGNLTLEVDNLSKILPSTNIKWAKFIINIMRSGDIWQGDPSEIYIAYEYDHNGHINGVVRFEVALLSSRADRYWQIKAYSQTESQLHGLLFPNFNLTGNFHLDEKVGLHVWGNANISPLLNTNHDRTFPVDIMLEQTQWNEMSVAAAVNDAHYNGRVSYEETPHGHQVNSVLSSGSDGSYSLNWTVDNTLLNYKLGVNHNSRSLAEVIVTNQEAFTFLDVSVSDVKVLALSLEADSILVEETGFYRPAPINGNLTLSDLAGNKVHSKFSFDLDDLKYTFNMEVGGATYGGELDASKLRSESVASMALHLGNIGTIHTTFMHRSVEHFKVNSLLNGRDWLNIEMSNAPNDSDLTGSSKLTGVLHFLENEYKLHFYLRPNSLHIGLILNGVEYSLSVNAQLWDGSITVKLGVMGTIELSCNLEHNDDGHYLSFSSTFNGTNMLNIKGNHTVIENPRIDEVAIFIDFKNMPTIKVLMSKGDSTLNPNLASFKLVAFEKIYGVEMKHGQLENPPKIHLDLFLGDLGKYTIIVPIERRGHFMVLSAAGDTVLGADYVFTESPTPRLTVTYTSNMVGAGKLMAEMTKQSESFAFRIEFIPQQGLDTSVDLAINESEYMQLKVTRGGEVQLWVSSEFSVNIGNAIDISHQYEHVISPKSLLYQFLCRHDHCHTKQDESFSLSMDKFRPHPLTLEYVYKIDNVTTMQLHANTVQNPWTFHAVDHKLLPSLIGRDNIDVEIDGPMVLEAINMIESFINPFHPNEYHEHEYDEHDYDEYYMNY